MGKEINWSLLILCAILSQGIWALSEKTIENSSDLHVRKKRLIDRSSHGNIPVRIEQSPYIVNILINNVPTCAGSILSPIVVLTAAHCVFENNWQYTILSGSHFTNRGRPHDLRNKIIHPGYNPHTSDANGIALIHIFPPIDLVHSPNRPIELATGPVAPHTLGTLSGWGAIHHERSIMKFPEELRSFTVPILNNAECQWRYGRTKEITDRHLCTYDKNNEKLGAIGDAGNPLVVNDKLVGVLLWTGYNPPKENPDVFARVSHPALRIWIIANTKIIEGW